MMFSCWLAGGVVRRASLSMPPADDLDAGWRLCQRHAAVVVVVAVVVVMKAHLTRQGHPPTPPGFERKILHIVNFT